MCQFLNVRHIWSIIDTSVTMIIIAHSDIHTFGHKLGGNL